MVMRALDLVSVWEQAVGWGRSMVGLGLLRRIRGTHLPHKEVQGKTDGRIPDYRARVRLQGAGGTCRGKSEKDRNFIGSRR